MFQMHCAATLQVVTCHHLPPLSYRTESSSFAVVQGRWNSSPHEESEIFCKDIAQRHCRL
jgi:hypothetical protein